MEPVCDLTDTYPTKKPCDPNTKWSRASQGQEHEGEREAAMSAQLESSPCQIRSDTAPGSSRQAWNETTRPHRRLPFTSPACYLQLHPLHMQIALTWNWSRENLFCSSLLHSLMWTGAGTWVSKAKGWIKPSPSSTFSLLWIKMTVLLWPKRFITSFTVHVIKAYLSVFSLLFICILWIKVALKKNNLWNPQCRVFSVAPKMTLFSLPNLAVMKLYSSKSKNQQWKSF